MDSFLKKRKVNRPHFREIDIEEIFLDKALKKKEEGDEPEKEKLEVPLKRINFLILLLWCF